MNDKPRFKVGQIVFWRHSNGDIKPAKIIKCYRRIEAYDAIISSATFMKPNYTPLYKTEEQAIDAWNKRS